MKNPTLSNFTYLILDKLGKFLLTAGTVALMARYLGPELIGKLNYTSAYAGLLGFFVVQGLDQFVVRELLRSPNKKSEILAGSFLIKAGGSLLILLLSLLIWAFSIFSAELSFLIFLFSFAFIANSFDFIDIWFQSQSLNKLSLISRQSGVLISCLFRVGMVFAHMPIWVFAFAQILESFCYAAIQIYIFRKRFSLELPLRQSFDSASQILKKGWPLIASSFLVLFYSSFGQLLLGNREKFADLGLFASSNRVLEYVSIFPMALSTAIFPWLAKSYLNYAEEFSAARKEIEIFLGAVNCLAWIGTLAVFFLSKPIIALLFGAKFSGSVPLLQILCWSIPPIFFSVIRHAWLTIHGRLEAALRFECIVTVLNLVLNTILITKFSANGAAFASLITAYAANIVAGIFILPIRDSIYLYVRGLRAFALFGTDRILRQVRR